MRPEDCEACREWNEDDTPCHHVTPRKPHLMKTRADLPKRWFVSQRTYTASTVRSFHTFTEAADYASGWTPLGGCR